MDKREKKNYNHFFVSANYASNKIGGTGFVNAIFSTPNVYPSKEWIHKELRENIEHIDYRHNIVVLSVSPITIEQAVAFDGERYGDFPNLYN